MATSLWLQTMAPLEQGDTIELQGISGRPAATSPPITPRSGGQRGVIRRGTNYPANQLKYPTAIGTGATASATLIRDWPDGISRARLTASAVPPPRAEFPGVLISTTTARHRNFGTWHERAGQQNQICREYREQNRRAKLLVCQPREIEHGCDAICEVKTAQSERRTDGAAEQHDAHLDGRQRRSSARREGAMARRRPPIGRSRGRQSGVRVRSGLCGLAHRLLG